MDNYKLIKLRSGESIIGDVKAVTDYKTLIIDKPMYYKVVSVVNQLSMIQNELLVFKNYNEFSKESMIELPVDFVATIMNPNDMIISYYVEEKNKQNKISAKSQDIPSFEELIDLPQDMIDQMMNNISDVLQSAEQTLQPIKKKRKKKSNPSVDNTKNKKDPTWGNKYTDWPVDPHDYL